MPSKPSVFSRAFSPVRHTALWVRGAPRWLQAAIALLLVGTAAAGGYYAFHKRAEGRTHRAIADAWKHFDEAARAGDESGMKAALDEVLAAAPDNALAARRKQTLETFDADPADEPMMVLSLQMNLRAGNLDGAAREADKRLAKEPKDWLARCVKAQHALVRGDRAAAEAELDQLPAPDDPRARLSPAGLLVSFRVFHFTGRDTTQLRTLVQTRVVAAARSQSVQTLHAAEKIGVVECYLEGFEPGIDKPQPAGLVSGWSAVSDLADRATDEAVAAGTVPLLVRVGKLAPRLAAALALFRKHAQVTPEQYAEFAKELEARARRAWEAVLAKDPKKPDAYYGLAWSCLRAQEVPAAWDWIGKGLAECGDDPDLRATQSRMLQAVGRPLAAWEQLHATAVANPAKPVWWGLTAEAAMAAGRRDLAIEACDALRKIDPDNKWAARTEASLWLAAGDANQAVQLLHKLGEPALAADPGAARVYAHALAESGLDVRIDGFLTLAEEASVKASSPAAVVSALRGLFEAPPSAARASLVAAKADRLVTDRWQDSAELFRLRADALARVAELTPPAYEPIRVRAAVQAYERLRAKVPDDPGAAFGLAALRLYGEDNAEQALRDLAPVRVEGEQPAARLELIGQAYRRAGKLTEAIAVLERAARAHDATAGCLTQLALAYHARGDRDKARAALVQASSRPRDDRQQADYVAAVKAIQP